MLLELKLVEPLIIEPTESRRQATKRPDEPELRRDGIYDMREPDASSEFETSLSFTLHFG
jgi:hypothetical protein